MLRRRNLPRPLSVLAVLAAVLFALWGIGGQLAGNSTLTATDEMVSSSPWLDAGLSGPPTHNWLLDDTYTSELPSTILFKQELQKGEGTGWNPYEAGGTNLGNVPNQALWSPLTVPYYLLPTWIAPAYGRLLEIVCAVAGSFLFLRRLRVSPAAAVTGGLIFAGSAFMVSWVGFPQTRVAAFIPVLFWTLERLIQERRVRDAALVAIPVASLLLGGFPSVMAYAMLTAGVYTVVRLLAEYRTTPKRLALTALGALGGLAAGAGLAMFQMVGFLYFYPTWLVQGRAQTPQMHLAAINLLETFSPWVFGTANVTQQPMFILKPNLVEAMSYISAAAVVLVLVALAMPRRGRALLPRGVWIVLFALAAGWTLLIYVGGAPLEVLQKLPVSRALFAANYIGRSRSILDFLLGVLAAVGFDLLLRRRAELPRLTGRLALLRVWPFVLGAGILALGAVLVVHGHHAVVATHNRASVQAFKHHLLIGALMLAAAGVCVLILRLVRRPDPAWGRKRTLLVLRFAAAAALPLLVAAQGGAYMSAYYPKSSKTAFYPETDTHRYLAANLGGQRFASSSSGMVFGTNAAYDLRSVNGHTFINAPFATLVEQIPGNPIFFETYIDFNADHAQATNPVLDLLGTKYFVTAPSDPVLGNPVNAPTDGTTTTLQPGTTVTVPVTQTGPLRGIAVTAANTLQTGSTATLEVVIKDASGKTVATSSRLTSTIYKGVGFNVPVAADSVAAGTKLTASLTVHGSTPLTVAADQGALALSTIEGEDDGLRLVHVEDSAIYLRLNAQPRIRWASTATVVPDQAARLALLSSGKVGADQVVLNSPGPAASGQSASVDVTKDGTDTVTTEVDAKGAGYLVVADADQSGWVATVDGKSAALLPADQGLVTVAVPAGKHTVTVRLAPPHATLGYAVSIATAVLLLLAVGGEAWWLRRRQG
ncbi:YfhO family protein [Streptacidiphilus sp. N1-10]|uniref:YfhO family protein n=1 Tax=Streptacidiphilus jeojiensis TaxID=3229225 RepID=A0ABV6XI47_9ACTN